MKTVTMFCVEPEIKKQLRTRLEHFVYNSDSMDDGTILGIRNGDKIASSEVLPIFWTSCESLDVLNVVAVVTWDKRNWVFVGKVKHNPGCKTFFLQKLNKSFQDLKFDRSNIYSIHVVKYVNRESTLI